MTALIPRIIHRTIRPGDTDRLVTYCWNSTKKHNPGWKLMTHFVSPGLEDVDNNFPLTNKYWHLCKSGAHIADLVRLEALWNFGGIYLDSDVELYKPLDDFLIDRPWMAREDDFWIGNAVIGAPPQSPEILQLINATIDKLVADDFVHGPTIATEYWTNNKNVKIFSSETFFQTKKNSYGKHHGNTAKPDSWVSIYREKYPELLKKVEQLSADPSGFKVKEYE